MYGLFTVRKVEELLFLARNMKKWVVSHDQDSLNSITEISESLRNVEILALIELNELWELFRGC